MRRNILDNVTVREFYGLDHSASTNALSQGPCALLDCVLDNSNVLMYDRALASTGRASDEVFEIPRQLTDQASTLVQLAAQNQAGYDIIISQRLQQEAAPLIISSQCKWNQKDDQVDSERANWLKKIKGMLRFHNVGWVLSDVLELH